MLLCKNKVKYCVDKPKPVIIDTSIGEEKKEHTKLKKDNFVACGCIITFTAKIYAKQFTKEHSAKKNWDKLVEKHKYEKYKNCIWVATLFDNFNFVDSKPVKSQLHKYINFRAQPEEKSMIVFDRLFVALILNCLPPFQSIFVIDTK